MAMKGDSSQNLSLKIAIVGAGISGLVAAHTLRKLGYRNITIFEALDRIGGKVHTIERDGYLYELGAIFSLDSYKTINALAKQYNVSLTKRSEKTAIISNGKRVSRMKFMHAKYSWGEIIGAQIRLFRILSKLKNLDAPGFSNVVPELYQNFKDFAVRNKLGPFVHLFEPGIIGYGYGYLHQTPALYYLKMLRNLIGFMLKDQLNSALGLNLGRIKMFDEGYQGFLEKIAGDFEVRVNAKITEVKREEAEDSFRIHITVNNKKETFDRLIISSVPAHTMEFLDANDEEKEVFSRVRFYYFKVTLFYGEGLPPGGPFLFEDSVSIKGLPGSIGRLAPENNIYQAYQMHWGEGSEKELERRPLRSATLRAPRSDAGPKRHLLYRRPVQFREHRKHSNLR
jgi:protoporphyrinogen/coproporphyrinogen III oxidase